MDDFETGGHVEPTPCQVGDHGCCWRCAKMQAGEVVIHMPDSADGDEIVATLKRYMGIDGG